MEPQGEAELFQALGDNLGHMYLGSDPGERRKADHWLQRLQRAPQGWALADTILGGRTAFCGAGDLGAHPLATHAVQFAAMTLHAKVSSDLHQLSIDQATALRGATLDHLARWSGPGIPPAVVKKLGLAVAALAVSTSWQGALAHVQGELQKQGPDAAHDCRTRVVAVELLAALPEQCAAKTLNVPLSRREAFEGVLREAGEGVLGVLTQVVAWASGEVRAQHPGGAQKLTAAAFECLRCWIAFCELRADHVAASPLFLGAFDAVAHPPLFDAACDVVVEALRRYDCRDPASGPVVGAAAPRVMALLPRFADARARNDDDEALGLCRVFSEMGEAYMPLIASAQDCNQRAIVDVMLACTEYPCRRVSGIPLRFWYYLARAITSLRDDEPCKASLRRLMFEPYQRLAKLAVRLAVRTEDDCDATRDDRDADGDEYKRHRTDLFECLADCAYILGTDGVARAVAEEVQVLSAPGAATPDSVEACLFSIRALADFLQPDEAFVFPSAVRMIQALPADWARARAQACQLIGALATWLRQHAAEFLEPAFQFLLAELAKPPEVRRGREHCSQAAKALKRLCDRCAPELAKAGALGLRDQVAGKLPLKDELEILEGLGAVAAASEAYEQLVQGVRQLAGPPAAALAALAQDPNAEPRAVARELDRLTAVFRAATPRPELFAGRPHPVLEVVDQLWPVFEAVAGRHRAAHLVVEKLCRCYKHAMRSCRKHFEPMLARMTAHLVGSFEAGVRAAQTDQPSAPLSSFVYCASICITEFGDEPLKRAGLFDMLAALSTAAFSLLAQPEDFARHPDVVEEYFYLVSRFLDYCPAPLLENPLLGHVLRAAALGLAVEHREALRGVLHCCERSVSEAVKAAVRGGENVPAAIVACEPRLDPRDAPQSPEEMDLARRHAGALARLLVSEGHGRAIVDGLLRALAGDLPGYVLDEGGGSVLAVLWKLRLFCPPQNFTAWCQETLAVVTASFASQEITADLLRAVAIDPPRRDAFYDAFHVFARCFAGKKSGSRRQSR